MIIEQSIDVRAHWTPRIDISVHQISLPQPDHQFLSEELSLFQVAAAHTFWDIEASLPISAEAIDGQAGSDKSIKGGDCRA